MDLPVGRRTAPPRSIAAGSGTRPATSWRSATARTAATFGAVVEQVDDLAAALALRTRQVRWLDRTMYALSACGDDGRIWIAASLVEATRTRSPRRFVELVGWLAAESALVNFGIKRVARRPRPDHLTDHEYWLRIPSDSSFPSGHAASSGLMAVLLSRSSPFAPLWVALAAGVGVSRVHVGVHHGSDVVAGWAVGVGMGLVARRASRSPSTTGRGVAGHPLGADPAVPAPLLQDRPQTTCRR